MKKVYSHKYDIDMDSEDVVQAFEKDAAVYLKGARAENVGGVILYYKGKREIAYMDYENNRGSVRELMTDAEYDPWEFGE